LGVRGNREILFLSRKMVAGVGIEPTTRGLSKRCRSEFPIFLGIVDSRFPYVTESVTADA